jgi:hypothetical protein
MAPIAAPALSEAPTKPGADPVENAIDYETPDDRAPVEISDRSCYEVVVRTDVMSPRLERDWMMLQVHPYLPPRIDQSHLFYSADGARRAIGELVRWDDATWYIKHYKPDPDKVMKLSRSAWPTCHLVIGWYVRELVA